MSPAALRERLRSRRVIAGLIVVGLLVVAGIVALAARGDGVQVRSRMIAGTPEPGGRAVQLDTSLYLPASTPAPAVLLSQGFGGDKSDLATTARAYADHGYVALTYTARGFGRSGGFIHFASPDYEVHDGTLLLDYLASLPQVRRVSGKPQLATAGSSYGGGLSLLIAAADHRVGAVAADITWNDLSHALFPNAAGTGPGVFKKLWTGQLFGNGFGTRSALGAAAALPSGSGGGSSGGSSGGSGDSSSGSTSTGATSTGATSTGNASTGDAPTGSGPSAGSAQATRCGRFASDVCAAYQASAAAGTPNAALQALMRRASPATVASRIDAPTLLTQGEQDSLFPLSEADANARGIAAHGTPVRVEWRAGGHDAGGVGTGTARTAAYAWFDSVFRVFGGSPLPRAQPFRFAEQAGVVSAATGDATQQTLQAAGYPGLGGTPRRTRTVQVSGPAQTISSPGGGVPAVISSIPGLGGISTRFDTALALLPSAAGQTASFASGTLRSPLLIAGQPTVRLTITPRSTRDVTLFASLRDVAADGSATLPSRLVSPLRLTGLTPGTPTTVTVRLPAVVRNVLTGHRLVLDVSATDFAFANPTDSRTYGIALAGGAGSAAVTVPTASGSPIGAGHPLGWLIVGVVALILVAAAVTATILRRRRVLKPRPDLAHVPVAIASLVKEYAGGYRAVDDVSFRVERGQVVGLLGPNGAGKTTALRVLVGLITPTSGTVHVFGQPVYPGAPVLARIGAFIEGPGFLPHLSGRENLRLYWAATGRRAEDADFDTALEIAGLGGSIDRKVRAYSQGMRQRLGIAQAMLGLPEVLVLDEPTNGLDPPQIAEMREVLKDYARTGRTVVVSSHLLAEVEQTCTHVVVMHRGRLVAAGSVEEISGSGGTQLAVPDPAAATRVLAAAGITAETVPARRALEDVFLDLIGEQP